MEGDGTCNMMRTMTLIDKNPFPDGQLTRKLAITVTVLKDVQWRIRDLKEGGARSIARAKSLATPLL